MNELTQIERKQIWFAAATLDAARSQLALLMPPPGEVHDETVKMMARMHICEQNLRAILEAPPEETDTPEQEKR